MAIHAPDARALTPDFRHVYMKDFVSPSATLESKTSLRFPSFPCGVRYDKRTIPVLLGVLYPEAHGNEKKELKNST
jgi:hypothetical protein